MLFVILNILASLTIPAIIMTGLAGLYMHLAPLIPHITGAIDDTSDVVQFAHFIYNASEPYAIYAFITFVSLSIIWRLFRFSGTIAIATVIIKFVLWCVMLISHTINITDPVAVDRAVRLLGELPSADSYSDYCSGVSYSNYCYDQFNMTPRCHDTVGLLLVYPTFNAANVITQVRIYAPFSSSMTDLQSLFAVNGLIREVLLEPGISYIEDNESSSYAACDTNTKLQVVMPREWQKLAVEKISYVYNKFSKCGVLVTGDSGTGKTSLARYVSHSLQKEGFDPVIIRGLSPANHETPFAFLAKHAPIPTRLCPNIIVIENWAGMILASRPAHICPSAIVSASFIESTERLKEFRDALLQLEYTIIIAISSNQHITTLPDEESLVDRNTFPLQYTAV
jgi:hypothetical protein